MQRSTDKISIVKNYLFRHKDKISIVKNHLFRHKDKIWICCIYPVNMYVKSVQYNTTSIYSWSYYGRGELPCHGHNFVWLLSANHRCVLLPVDQREVLIFVTLNSWALLYELHWSSSPYGMYAYGIHPDPPLYPGLFAFYATKWNRKTTTSNASLKRYIMYIEPGCYCWNREWCSSSCINVSSMHHVCIMMSQSPGW